MAETSANDPSPPEIILVVDGDVLIRMVISEYLRHCGYRVFEAANADEALTVLRAGDLAVDVVFTEVDIEGTMNGFGLARWIREHQSHVGVVLASSPVRAVEEAEDLCENGPTLKKPYESQHVLDRIRRLLAARKT